MAPLTDDAGETFRDVPSQWSNAGNHEFYGRRHENRYVPQSLPDAPTKLQKQALANTTRPVEMPWYRGVYSTDCMNTRKSVPKLP
ncbi:unnamed protein product [Protopolystoma xenopodis]|uniref:Uncharacterized protein n=1 Tax=Protopolystoma xenopodis TaxID=117903 RepID=A0A3S5BU80_9PLAT|nr:unnamed protein product [Protopolystoma xenopodis]